MIEVIISKQALMTAAFTTMICGLSIRIMLSLVKQKWASTYHHTMSYTLLPLITFVITKVISGNIALSLGMIGALSIVRFRNPVKNPFELVIFFALITIGITTSVNPQMGILLTVLINTVILTSYVVEMVARKFDFHIFSLSFDEGNSNNIIEIQSSSAIDSLNDSKFLLQYVSDKKLSEHHYRLASKSKKDIESIRKSSDQNKSVTSIEVRFN
jgi:hypothetical protein